MDPEFAILPTGTHNITNDKLLKKYQLASKSQILK